MSLSSYFPMASSSREISKTPFLPVFQSWNSSPHFLPPGMARLPLPGSVHLKLQCSTVPRDLSYAHQLLNLISMPINKYLLSVLLGKPRWQFQTEDDRVPSVHCTKILTSGPQARTQSSKQNEQRGIFALFGLMTYFLPLYRILSASE